VVLQDTQLRDMSHDNLLRVTRPKVEGSINLDTLFKDSPLDFFVFFSSATMVIGNPGQSNYAAANAFMCSLAEQRRKRGQAASVINIGPILGVGYLAQQDMDLSSQAESGGYTFISESDFHQLFAEAVLAGRPGGSTPI
jgi:hybrid polyketide synthase / nonribosomal peptide synthetase ACE1